MAKQELQGEERALSERLHPLPAKVLLSLSRTSPVLRALHKLIK